MKVLFGFFVVLIGTIMLFFWWEKLKKPNEVGNKTVLPISISPTPYDLLVAPTESLRGKLSILSDGVFHKDRVATAAAKKTEDLTLQQGESIETNENGQAKVEFPEVLTVTIDSNTTLDVIQTLPINLTFTMKKGSATFKKLGSNNISLRCRHLLMKIDGTVKVLVDENSPIISVEVSNGEVILAYNNRNFETQSYKISDGQKIEFNDSTREVDLI